MEVRETRVKVLTGGSRTGLTSVTGRLGFSFTFDPDCVAYDWLVVFDELPYEDVGTCRKGREPLACPRTHTILCTWEPVSIKSYSRAYTRQFAYLLTNRPPEAEGHPGYRLGRGYFPAMHGHLPQELAAHPSKTKTVSAVCSAKQMKHTQHFARYRLVSELAKAVPELDWFGFGVKPLAKKCEALDAYKYHVAVENHIGVHHWTEKFADAILCECLPFYAGDPALTEIFPADCFIPIPINDPVEAAHIVKAAIAAGEYEKRREAVLEAKRMILEKYNFFDQVAEVIRSAPTAQGAREHTGESIWSRRALRWHSLPALVEDLWWHARRMK